MDTLYKGLLKNYSVVISDNVKNSEEDVYEKIFTTLENYVTEILAVKIELGDSTAKEEYEQYMHTTVGKLEEKDRIMQKVVLLNLSRKLFIHSLPLVATEKCYRKILKDVRALIVNSKTKLKRQNNYETFFDVVEDYNVKLLSTKVYWDNPQERLEYKKFWEKYEKQRDNPEKKQILVLREDIKKLNVDRKKYAKIIEIHKEKLTEMGAIRTIKLAEKKYGKMIYNKRSA